MRKYQGTTVQPDQYSVEPIPASAERIVTMEDVAKDRDRRRSFQMNRATVDWICNACLKQVTELDRISKEAHDMGVGDEVDDGLLECRTMTDGLRWLMESHVAHSTINGDEVIDAQYLILLPARLIWHIQMLHEGGYMTDREYEAFIRSYRLVP